MRQVGTRHPLLIAAFLNVVPPRLRDWKRRGLIGPTCDVATRVEGYDVAQVATVALTRRGARKRRVLDNEAFESHASRK